MLISVITPVYNDEKFIKESVESILNQTFKDFEYIVVDDGSTDNTLRLLRDISKKDSRLQVLSQLNQGAAIARNRAIAQSKGTYIALQDSDDISFPNRLQLQLEQLLNSPPNLISCTGHKIIDMNSEIIAVSNKLFKNINNNILSGRICFCTPTLMIAREALLKVKGYNPFYKKSEDVDLILRLLENKNYIEKINSCLYSYRIRENSEGSKNNGGYCKRAYENHRRRIAKKSQNFETVINDYKLDKNFIIKRLAGEIFYSENYESYIKYYLKHFYKLSINKHLLYLFYALFPPPLKRIIKSIR